MLAEGVSLASILQHFQFNPWKFEDPSAWLAVILGGAALLFILSRVNVPVLSLPHHRQSLAARLERITAQHNQIESALAEAERMRDDYATRLSNIEAEAKARLDEAVRDAEAARAELIAEAQELAAAHARRAQEELAREQTRSRLLLRQQVVNGAIDAAEHAVRAESTDTVQRQLIADFISTSARNGTGAG